MKRATVHFGWLTAIYVCLMVLPFLAMGLELEVVDFGSALTHSGTLSALWLSLWTSTLSLSIIIVTGVPIAWWLRNQHGTLGTWVSTLLQLPIVIPPAVIGVALLTSLGPNGVIGGALDVLGIRISFTPMAVIVAQILVASPFFVQAATNAFRAIQPEHLEVAQSLGSSPVQTLRYVALPIAMPGLLTGGMLAWARSLGEFGATLLFAGNLTGETQTLPVLIFSVLESDVAVAGALSLIWAIFGLGLLYFLRRLGRTESPDL